MGFVCWEIHGCHGDDHMDLWGIYREIYNYIYMENIRRWRESGGFWDGVSIDWLNYGELTTMGTASISRYDTTLQYIL